MLPGHNIMPDRKTTMFNKAVAGVPGEVRYFRGSEEGGEREKFEWFMVSLRGANTMTATA
jgi:hypothetical protein